MYKLQPVLGLFIQIFFVGKPSIPILTIENMVVLDMRSLYSGIENVTDDRSYFAFNVLVESSSGRVVYNKTFPITKYKSNSTETRTLEGITRSGDYVVLVSASNIYGVSDTATINTTVIVSTTVSPTPTRTTTTSSPSSRPPGRGQLDYWWGTSISVLLLDYKQQLSN